MAVANNTISVIVGVDCHSLITYSVHYLLMVTRAATVVFSGLLATLVLFVSVRSASSIDYKFNLPPSASSDRLNSNVGVSYSLPTFVSSYSKILWPFISLVTRLEMALARDPIGRVNIALENADIRLVMAREYMELGDYEVALTTLLKSEHYLMAAARDSMLASASGEDTSEVMSRLATASLKHREVMEASLLDAPEDARPVIMQTMDLSKAVFREMSNKLWEMGESAPLDPFKS